MEEKLSGLQELFGLITGYSGHEIEDQGASDDGYFECDTIDEKLGYLEMCDWGALDCPKLSREEIEGVRIAIDSEKSGTNDWFWIFEELGH